MANLYPTWDRIPLALTVSTAAYTAGDVVGGLLTFDFSTAARGSLLSAVVMVDAANQSEPYTLWLFNAMPTEIADADPFAPTTADLKKVITRIAIAADDYATVNSLAHAEVRGINRQLPAADTVYGYLVPDDTPDYAATTDLWIALDLIPETRGRS